MNFTLDNITFNEDELDYESNGGNPIIISSFSGIQVFDSYLINKGTEYKLYRPSPNNIPISYSCNLICTRSKIQELNALIFKQVNQLKQYRLTHEMSLIEGFTCMYGNLINNVRVWITSLSINSSYTDIESNSEKIRCKIDLIEAE